MKKTFKTFIFIIASNVMHLIGCAPDYTMEDLFQDYNAENINDTNDSYIEPGCGDLEGVGGSSTTSSTSSGSTIPDIECQKDSDCGEAENFCERYSCYQNQCVLGTKPAGTLVPEQISGDCKKSVCAGNKILDTVDDTDISPNSCLSCNFGDLINNCPEEIKCHVLLNDRDQTFTCPFSKIDWTDSLGNINHCDPQVKLSPGTSCPIGNECRVITATASYIGVCE